MTKTPYVRAVLSGLGFALVGMIVIGLAGSIGMVVAGLTSLRLAGALHEHVLDPAAEVAGVVVMLLAGYVAASHVERRKVLVGVMTGLLPTLAITLLAMAAAAALGYWRELAALGAWPFVWGAAIGALPPAIGALVQRRRGGDPVRVGRLIGLTFAYALLTLGGLAVAGVVMVLLFYKGDYAPLATWHIGAIGAAFALVPACALFLLHRRGGLVVCLFKRPAGIASLIALAVPTALFVRAELVTYPSEEPLHSVMREMNARYALPPRRNAAPIWLEAFAAIDRDAVPDDLPADGLWDPAENEQWARWLADTEEAVRLARLAAARPDSYFDVVTWEDEDDPYEEGELRLTIGDGFGREPKQLAWAITARARRSDLSVEDSLAMTGIAVELASGLRRGGRWRMLVSAVCESIAMGAVRARLSAPDLSAADLRRIEAFLRDWSASRSLDRDHWRLVARLTSYEMLETTIAFDSDSVWSFLGMHMMPRPYLLGILEEGLAEFEEDLRVLPLHEVARKHKPQGGFLWGLPGDNQWEGMYLMMENLLVGERAGPLTRHIERGAQLAVLRGYVAARICLAETGRLPQTWDDLVPDCIAAVPEDPYTGRPLMLRAEAGRTIVYSLGANGEDESGEGFFTDQEKATARDEAEERGEWFDWFEQPDDVPLAVTAE